ncbi:MAG TPA: c-type cytochrome [Steroidobacteraceae bacterium]|nr:c-type cytochrome [Steroidobacteraceae bacterium]
MQLGSFGRPWLFASVLAGLAVSLGAHAAGDAALGKKKFYTCYGCHGIPNYRNAYPDYRVPKLRHQHAAYIVAALQEYQAGTRSHPTMHAQASSLSEQDMEDIAAYLQGPEPIQPTTTMVGKIPPQAEVCAACHGANGTGVAAPLVPKPPILAGQHEDYLIQALNEYRAGTRPHPAFDLEDYVRENPIMMGMAASLRSEADVRIVAHWFASQHSALATATPDSK